MIAGFPALFCLAFLILGTRGQEDFDLESALDPVTPEKAPVPTPKPNDGSFKPASATAAPKPAPKPTSKPADDTNVKPTKKPQPDQGGGGGGGGGGGRFGDTDLGDVDNLPPDDPSSHGGNPSDGEGQGEPEKKSIIAGVLSTLGVAAVGAISSFIAYQKKKLCFKGQGDDPENVNMDNQKGDQNDPQVQSTLLEK